MRPLLLLLALLALAYAFTTYGIDETLDRDVDPWILTYIAIIYTVAVVVMLIATRSWSVIGLGLLATMTGDALLYGAGSGKWTWLTSQAWVVDLIRACFLVGGTYLLVGMVLWVIRNSRDGRGAMA